MTNDWIPVVSGDIVISAGIRNITEWAKKTAFWYEIQLLDAAISAALEGKLREGDPLPTVGSRAK